MSKDCTPIKFSDYNPNIEAKNELDIIDGCLGESLVLNNKAQHKFICGNNSCARQKMGLDNWIKEPTGNVKKIPK